MTKTVLIFLYFIHNAIIARTLVRNNSAYAFLDIAVTDVRRYNHERINNNGEWPSGKAPASGAGDHRFKSYLPSQTPIKYEMTTKHGIPQKQLDVIFARDKACVYCHKQMITPYDITNRSNSVTIEHLNHRADWDSVQDFVSNNTPVYSIIALCCGSCNSSRGSKSLSEWFQAEYCRMRNIEQSTVSEVVRDYMNSYEKVNNQV